MTDEVMLTARIVRGLHEPDRALLELSEGLLPPPSRLVRDYGDSMEAPFDLRVTRPRAVDLRKLWELTGQPLPPIFAATLGPRRPILLQHSVTPFPPDGSSPGGVWGLGYEFVAHDIDANTEGVAPNDELLTVAHISQKLHVALKAGGAASASEAVLGVGLGGSIGVPEGNLSLASSAAEVNLPGMQIAATTDQRFHFAVRLGITLRKVVGAPVGMGGAQWKMYRQDEQLDRSHTLLQTVLVPEGAREMRCTIKTWARRATWLGALLGQRHWKYDDQIFCVNLT